MPGLPYRGRAGEKPEVVNESVAHFTAIFQEVHMPANITHAGPFKSFRTAGPNKSLCVSLCISLSILQIMFPR
jgi:hypothetical protein